MINQERLQLAMDALRSGDYERGFGRLHRAVDDRHDWCCLGVLSDVAEKNGCGVRRDMVNEYGDESFERFGSEDDEYLSPEVMAWYGFESKDPTLRDENGDVHLASTMNDDTSLADQPGFGYIADAFQRTYGTNDTESVL